MRISIPTQRNFSFKRTTISHGWSDLLPFHFDQASWTLLRVIDLDNASPVTVRVSGTRRELRVDTSSRLSKAATAKVIHDVRHMFRLDDDIAGFYRAMSAEPDFAWVVREGAGRMLRSPTVFEDLVKMICTTNCSWALTSKMVTGLVENLGRESKDGRRTFPKAEAMALMPLKFYVEEVRAGYRALYLKELAERVAGGELNVNEWLGSDLPTPELIKKMKTVKGVGDYAAENLLKLVGRYDGLALDSWTRTKFARVRNGGRMASDKKIAHFYARFNSWRGLALWCDMTRDWMDGENAIAW
jgi:3-methyladenine DNA glycosylase/8-oxoguanine DNA glycosylase